MFTALAVVLEQCLIHVNAKCLLKEQNIESIAQNESSKRNTILYKLK